MKSDVIVVSGDFVEKRSAFLASYPLSLPALFIKAFTKKGDYVLDPFAGTGTTGYACRKLGRHFILIEINRENINVEKLFNYKPKKRT